MIRREGVGSLDCAIASNAWRLQIDLLWKVDKFCCIHFSVSDGFQVDSQGLYAKGQQLLLVGCWGKVGCEMLMRTKLQEDL